MRPKAAGRTNDAGLGDAPPSVPSKATIHIVLHTYLYCHTARNIVARVRAPESLRVDCKKLVTTSSCFFWHPEPPTCYAGQLKAIANENI